MSFKENTLEFIEDRQIGKRALTWGLPALLIGLMFFGPYDITKTNGETMGPKLGSGERYGVIAAETICMDDILKVAIADASKVRAVMAFPGSKVAVTDTGYSIDGDAVAMSAAWVSAARAAIESPSFVVPDDQIVVRRTTPDAAAPDDYEAFRLAPMANVEGVFSRVLIAFNPLRIGSSLRSDSTDCRSVAGAGET